MIVKGRWFKTTDGRLVREGDLDAAFLAYAPGDEVADPEARKSGLADLEKESEPAEKPEDKSAPQPANKARAKPADK